MTEPSEDQRTASTRSNPHASVSTPREGIGCGAADVAFVAAGRDTAKCRLMRAAVIGHVEWVDFLRVDRTPRAGDIVHATEVWAEPAGGGPVAAVQLAKLAGEATLYTVFGDDDLGHRAHRELQSLGLRVEAVFREASTRRAITHIDRHGERTITVLGERLAPEARDPLPWDDLEGFDAIYVCAADAELMRLARRARVLVATSRILDVIRASAVRLDALVGSATDPGESYRIGDLPVVPTLSVHTEGSSGGRYSIEGRRPGIYAPTRVQGPVADSYGSGDSFAGGLAYALAAGLPPEEAIALAGRCGAAALTGRGPYQAQLRAADLSDVPT